MRSAALLLLAICASLAFASGACSEPRLCNDAECMSCDAVCCDASTTDLPDMLPDACGGDAANACADHGGVLQSFRGNEPFTDGSRNACNGPTTCVVRCCGGGIFVSTGKDSAECIFLGGNAKLCRDEGGPFQILYDGKIVLPAAGEAPPPCPSLRECVVLCDGVEKSRTTEFTEEICTFFHKDDCAAAMKTEIQYDGTIVFTATPPMP